MSCKSICFSNKHGLCSGGFRPSVKGRPGHQDPEIKGGGGGSGLKKEFFGPLGLNLDPSLVYGRKKV